MGGMNHQPCNKKGTEYLKHSTRMSRAVSSAHIALEQSNVYLEDVLLAELNGGNGSLDPIILQLEKSENFLMDFRQCINDLRDNMKKNCYSDLPTLYAGDFNAVGTQLSEAGVVQLPEWQEVLKAMKEHSFYEVLDKFSAFARLLVANTGALREKIILLSPYAEKGMVNFVLEGNGDINIKVEFAVLYTTWNRFHRLFLASSMLSTELWYAYNRSGSLLGGGAQSNVA